MEDFAYTRKRRRRDPALLLAAIASYADALFRDNVSGTNFSQTYARTNRTRINSAGLLEAVAANTPVIDYVGASLTPMLRMEPAGMNLLFNSRFATNGAGFTATATMANAGAVGADGVAGAGLLVTDDSAIANEEMYLGISKSAGDSTTYFKSTVWVRKLTTAACYPLLAVVLDGGTKKYAGVVINHVAGTVIAWDDNTAANIGSRITPSGAGWQVDVWATDNGANTSAYWNFMPALNSDASATADVTAQGSVTIDYGKLSTGNLPSSLFIGAAAIGDELVTNGNFSAVVDTVGELSSGLFTVGNGYKISARLLSDFTTAGSPDNVVGTYFNATTTGAGLLDAANKVFPVTFANWTASNFAPQATAGLLTGKAVKLVATATGTIQQNVSAVAGNVYRVSAAISQASAAKALTSGIGGGTSASHTAASETIYDYIISTTTGNLIFSAAADWTGTIDDASGRTHGTVRITEANTISLTMPAAVAAALAATGTLVVDWMPSFARAALSTHHGIISAAAAVANLIWINSGAGNIDSADGTNEALSTAAYTANVLHRLALQWPSSANKFKVGASVAMAGIAYGAEAAFDGAFTVGANLIPGYTLYAPQWIKSIRFYNKLLTDAQVNALP